MLPTIAKKGDGSSFNFTTHTSSSITLTGLTFLLLFGLVLNSRVICLTTCVLPKQRRRRQRSGLVGHLAFVHLLGTAFWLFVCLSGAALQAVLKSHGNLEKILEHVWNTILGIYPTNLVLIMYWSIKSLRGEIPEIPPVSLLPWAWLVSATLGIPPKYFSDGSGGLELYEILRFLLYFVAVVIYFSYGLYVLQKRVWQLDFLARSEVLSVLIGSIGRPLYGWEPARFKILLVHSINFIVIWLGTGILLHVRFCWEDGKISTEENWISGTMFMMEVTSLADMIGLLFMWLALLFFATTPAVYLILFENDFDLESLLYHVNNADSNFDDEVPEIRDDWNVNLEERYGIENPLADLN